MNGSYNGHANIVIQQHNYNNDPYCSETGDELPSTSSSNNMRINTNGPGKNMISNGNPIIQTSSITHGNSMLHGQHHNQNIYSPRNSFHSPYHHSSEYQNNNPASTSSNNVSTIQYTTVDSISASDNNIMTINTIQSPSMLHNVSQQQMIITSCKDNSSSLIQNPETSGNLISININNSISGSRIVNSSAYLEHHPNNIIISDIDVNTHHQVNNTNYITTNSRSHISPASTYYLERVSISPLPTGTINNTQVLFTSNINSHGNGIHNSKHSTILAVNDNIGLKNCNNINSSSCKNGQQPRIIHSSYNRRNIININSPRALNNYKHNQQNMVCESQNVIKNNTGEISCLNNEEEIETVEYIPYSSTNMVEGSINNSNIISLNIDNNDIIEIRAENCINDNEHNNDEHLMQQEKSKNILECNNVGSKEKLDQNKFIENSNKKKEELTKQQKLESKRARQAEVARRRYHNLSEEEKKELNRKRTLAQKLKRQRDKEMNELEGILRQTNDIVEDPEINKELKGKKMRARWAEAARNRYHRMTPEEKKAYNLKRRMKQLNSFGGDNKELTPEERQKVLQQNLKQQNAKKAEAARMRYHSMTDEQKRAYNRKRTEALRKKRDEEEKLLSIPVKNASQEKWEQAQKILSRNEKRAAAARLRYQKMTPEERREYNRRKPKSKSIQDKDEYCNSEDFDDRLSYEDGSNRTFSIDSSTNYTFEENDILSNIERDVVRRTHIAKQTIIRQNNDNFQKLFEGGRNINVNSTSNFLSTLHRPCNEQIILNDVSRHNISEESLVYSQEQLLHLLPESPQIISNGMENYQSLSMSSQAYHNEESDLIDL
uniref:BZIP domain-containing protein n=1 Tax=Parastrongyloides trichosuri TaxID=131310 RepID=A0A0N5A5B2_PARTI